MNIFTLMLNPVIHTARLGAAFDGGTVTDLIYPGDTLNLAGGRSGWETMGALIKGESFDLESGEHSLNLGVPSRFPFVTPVSRLERDSKDNIIVV